MTPTFASSVSSNKFTLGRRNFHSPRLLSLFVALFCTSVMNSVVAQASDASLTPVGTITKAMTNREVTVQATISNIREPSSARAPYNVSLTQDGATLPLIYWSDMQPQVAAKEKVGNVIRVTAQVNVYRETLQLRLRNPSTFEVVTEVAGTATPATPDATAGTPASVSSSTAPAATVIGAIKPDWADRIVIISGTIATSESADNIQKLGVQDATGEIQAVLGEKALAGVSATQLQPGRVVTITGPVKFDNGTRQIVPDAAGNIKIAPQ